MRGVASPALPKMSAVVGFGMLNYKEVVNSIRCRQLGKMFDDSFNHPLKRMVIIEDKKFMSGRCINKTADSVAKDAFNLIFNTTMGKIGKISNEEILGDECLLHAACYLRLCYLLCYLLHATCYLFPATSYSCW